MRCIELACQLQALFDMRLRMSQHFWEGCTSLRSPVQLCSNASCGFLASAGWHIPFLDACLETFSYEYYVDWEAINFFLSRNHTVDLPRQFR